MSLIVACLNAGNYQGRGHRYVRSLHAQVAQHLSAPHRFVAFTDDEAAYPDGIETRPLPVEGLNGWFNKLSLFKAGVFQPGERVIYFDLDTYIVDSIGFMADYTGRFAMLAPYGLKDIHPEFDGPQSGTMAWEGGFGAEIWDKFVADGMPSTPGGDQKFINNMGLNPDLWQNMHPAKFASYKLDCMDSVPPGVACIGFHGLPRPHQAGGWARTVWRESEAALTQ